MIEYDSHSWWSHLFDIKGSMVREILGRVAACVAWSALVVLVDREIRNVGVPSTVHNLVGLALGLLLVFRTNASYDRFWEARKLWGGIVNECRNLVREARGFLAGEPELLDTLTRWTVAFPYACMNSLRGRASVGPAAALLPEAEVRAVAAAPHPVMAVTQKMTGCLVEARDKGAISDIVATSIDDNIGLLIGYIGACERIRSTPLPFAYVVHLRRALILYCATLPFALVNDFGWATVLDTLLVTYIFFGIEEIGVEIEDPFGQDDNDLPLEAIAAKIAGNLLGPGGMSDGVSPAAIRVAS